MDFMFFEGDPILTQRAQHLNTLKVEPTKAWDWAVLDQYGLFAPLGEMMTHTYEDGFVDDGLFQLFRNEAPIYKELLVEFLSSFQYNEGPRDELFNKRLSITFRLCDRWQSMSLIGFSRVLGLVERKNNKVAYKNHLDHATTQQPPGYSLDVLWPEIGMGVYDSHSCRESDLKSPLFRLLHRMLAFTVLYHTQPERINGEHLRGMWYALHPEDRWNLPHAMALMFQRASNGDYGTLPNGQFVTTIAERLDLLTDYRKEACAKVDVVQKGRLFYVQAMILKKLHGNTFRPYYINELKDEATPKSKGKRTRISNATSSSGVNDDLSMGHLSRQLDNLGWYLDDFNKQNAQAFNVPEMRMWNARMGYPNVEGDEDEEDGMNH